MTAITKSSRRWLFGPLPDLMLGCGLAYLLVFCVLAVAGSEVQAVVPAGLLVLGALVTGTPHYGATLLRVYERREDQRAYSLFAVWATLLIAAVFVVGTQEARVASLLFTVYVTWNAWHYTGQNYGIALMFLGRRGVTVAPPEKRLVYATFVLSYVLIFLSIHSGGSAGAGYAPQAAQHDTPVAFLSLSIPDVVSSPALVGVALAYLGSLVGAAVLLGRRASWRALGPAALIVLVQATWFVLPTLARASGTFQGIEPLAEHHAEYAFYWVAYAHAIQYMWITTYYASARDPETSRLGFFAKSVLAGAAIWGIPALIFSPRALGTLPFEGGLVLLVAAAVNIHHFVLDGAIWKLRDGRIARILIRSERAPAAVAEARRHFAAPLVWAVGAACAAIFVVETWERHFDYPAAWTSRDVQRLETAVRRLASVGRDGPDQHYELAQFLAIDGRWPEAMEQLRRSVELGPSARAWTGIAEMHERRERWREALEAYNEALDLAPDHVPALYRSGVILLHFGERETGRARLERARALDPANPSIAMALRSAGG